MMEFYVVFVPTPGQTIGAFAPLVDAEAAMSWAYLQQGTLLEMHYTAGSLLPVHSRWRCADRTALEAFIAAYPMVKAGLLRAEITELAPYEPLEKLRRAAGVTAAST